MTLDEFHLKVFLEDLDLYGGDLSGWPDDKKMEAEKLLQKSDLARAHLTALREAEALFVAGRMSEMTNGQTIAAHAVRMRQERPAVLAVRRASWALAGSMALALGLLVGIFPFGGPPADVLGAALWQESGIDVR